MLGLHELTIANQSSTIHFSRNIYFSKPDCAPLEIFNCSMNLRANTRENNHKKPNKVWSVVTRENVQTWRITVSKIKDEYWKKWGKK